jgi:predicted dienelactone hydrolase
VPHEESAAPTAPTVELLHDPSRRAIGSLDQPRPIRVYEWTPLSAAAGDPVVVVSHGTGGSGRDMTWLADPLSRAGFRVLAVDHHGNNFVDGYHPEGFLFGWERPRDLTFVLDTVSTRGPIGPVGAVGFSFGGYTAAALAGARIDADLVRAVLAGDLPLPPVEELPDALTALRATADDDALARAVAGAGVDLTDRRVRAAFLIAPGLGQLVTPESLAAVSVPVEIRWGDADVTNPFERDVQPYLDHIPHAHGGVVGPAVTHHHFIPALTTQTHARDQVASDAVAFFTRTLDIRA